MVDLYFNTTFFLLNLFIFWRANKNRRQLSTIPTIFVMRLVNEYRNAFDVYCSKCQSTPNTQVNIRNFGEKKKKKTNIKNIKTEKQNGRQVSLLQSLSRCWLWIEKREVLHLFVDI